MASTVLVICAHNDDGIIGAGGTLAKYAQENKKIRTIVFSYGELFNFAIKKELAIKRRVNESFYSDGVIGGKGITYLGITEGKFEEQSRKFNIKEKLGKIIKKEKPEKIFTHSVNDPHRDHKVVYGIVTGLIKEKAITCDVYSFDVWNIINISQRNKPKLVVDVTSTFKKKILAIRLHQSQDLFVVRPFILKLFLKDLTNGFNNNCRFAEVFNKIG